jgi:hypothetical protein
MRHWVFAAMLLIASPATLATAADSATIEPAPPPEANLHLSLDAFIARVHERNERIHFQKLEWDISQDAVANAKAIFEPQLVASYLHDYSHIPKTVEDYSSLGFLDSSNDTYTKRNNEKAFCPPALRCVSGIPSENCRAACWMPPTPTPSSRPSSAAAWSSRCSRMPAVT